MQNLRHEHISVRSVMTVKLAYAEFLGVDANHDIQS